MMSSLRIHRLVENLFEGDEDIFSDGLLQELCMRKQELCKSLSVSIFENMATIPVSKQILENSDIKKLILVLNEIDVKKSAKIEFKNA